MTVNETLTEGRRRLAAPCPNALIDTPRLDAALLLAEVLDTNREALIARGNETIGEGEREKFSELLERRRSGECIAYILGRKEWRGLLFAVNPNVLVPRPDTETLADAALEYIDRMAGTSRESFSLLDLCTGSGALSISLKNERAFLSVTATDISKEALEVARDNASRLLGDEKLSGKPIKFIESDLFENVRGKFNIIISNPPYVPRSKLASLAPEVRREPVLALDGGEDGLCLIRKIISEAAEFLHSAEKFQAGVLLLEAGPEQMREIRSLLESRGFKNIRVNKDLAGRDRVISAELISEAFIGCEAGQK